MIKHWKPPKKPEPTVNYLKLKWKKRHNRFSLPNWALILIYQNNQNEWKSDFHSLHLSIWCLNLQNPLFAEVQFLLLLFKDTILGIFMHEICVEVTWVSHLTDVVDLIYLDLMDIQVCVIQILNKISFPQKQVITTEI